MQPFGIPAVIGLPNRLITAAHCRLPRGVGHLGLQVLVWVGFYFAYNVTRGLADRNVDAAFANGEWIARTESRYGTLFGPWLQRSVDGSLMNALMSYTYWLSEFFVVGAALCWVYLRRHEHFAFFRNWLFLANVAGLVCYVFVPTAPPRMLPEWGFSDTLAASGPMDHGSVGTLSNQFAALPSLHAMDAFIVGVMLFAVVGRPLLRAVWLAWPAWVAFAVLATANHFWVDIAAGLAIAVVAAVALAPAHAVAFRSREHPSRGLLAAHAIDSPSA